MLIFYLTFFQAISQPCYPAELPSMIKVPVDKPYVTANKDFFVTVKTSPIEPKVTVSVPTHYGFIDTPSRGTVTPIKMSPVPNQSTPKPTSFIPSSECPTPKIAKNSFADSSCNSRVPSNKCIPSKHTYTGNFIDSSLASEQPVCTTNTMPSVLPNAAIISEPFSSEVNVPFLYNTPPATNDRTIQDNSLALSFSHVLQLLDKILQRVSITPCQNSVLFDTNVHPSYSDNVPVSFNNNASPYFVPQIENGVLSTNSHKYVEGLTNLNPSNIWNIDTPLPPSYIDDTSKYPSSCDHNLIPSNVYDISKEITNSYKNAQMNDPICTYSDSNMNTYPIMRENIDIHPNTYGDSYTSELPDSINNNLPIKYEIAESIIPKSTTYDNSNVISNAVTYVVPTYEYISLQNVETTEALPLTFAESPLNFIDTKPMVFDIGSPILTNSYNVPQLSPASSSFSVLSQCPSSSYTESNSVPLCLELLMPSSIQVQSYCVCDLPKTLPELTLSVEPLLDCSHWGYV